MTPNQLHHQAVAAALGVMRREDGVSRNEPRGSGEGVLTGIDARSSKRISSRFCWKSVTLSQQCEVRASPTCTSVIEDKIGSVVRRTW
jgi:hypothetical protein